MFNRSATVNHTLNETQARDCLGAFFQKEGTQNGISGYWQDKTYLFEATAQGMHISGRLLVRDKLIEYSVQLPLLAIPFSGWLPGMILHCLRRGNHLLERQEEGSFTPEKTNHSWEVKDREPLVLYLHIPKTGGISVGEYIYNHFSARKSHSTETASTNPFLKGDVYFCPFGFIKPLGLEVPEEDRRILKRHDLKAFIGHFWYGIHLLADRECRYVTVMRHPVDRMLSLYYYLEADNHMSLEDFVLQPSLKELDNDQTRRIAGEDPPIGGCDNKLLELAIENLKSFAAVGVSEHMEVMASKLRKACGWETESAPMGFRNINTHRQRLRPLSESEKSAILKANAYDLQLYEHILAESGLKA